MTTASEGPLAGVRVLELGSFIAGPFAGQLLGDYGADVIKVEPPDVGDPMRRWGITRDGDSLWWPSIARNKRSVTADLRSAEGRGFVQRIAASADVVLENFRPGRLADWGLDYEAVSATNPGVVMVHVSGFGHSGPRAEEAGFGSIGEAVGGIRHTTGDPDRPPARCGISLGDSLAALFAVVGTLAALREREASGRGQEVDVAIYEAVAALMESSMADYELAGHLRTRSGGALPGVAPSDAYPCADGSDVLIAGNADSVFRRLCAAMGRPDLADDPRFAGHAVRGENAAELDALVAEWTRTLASGDLLAALNDHGVPAGRVYTAADMLTDPHYLARDMVVRATARAGFDLPMTGVVPRFSRTPGRIRDVGPVLGEHTDVVAAELVAGASGPATTLDTAAFLARCEALVPTLAAAAPEGEQLRRVPDHVLAAVDEADVLRAVLPTALGGHGLGLDALCQGVRILARGCPATAWTVSFLMQHAWLLAKFPAGGRAELFAGGDLPRAAAPLAPTGQVVPSGGGFVVSGRWDFATAVAHADWVMVHGIELGEQLGTRFAALPVGEVTVEDNWDTAGMRATGSHTLVVDEVFVPAHRTIPGQALLDSVDTVAGDGLANVPLVSVLALTAAASAVGAAEAAVALYEERLRGRVLAYTLGEKAADQPVARARLGAAVSALAGCRSAWDRAIAAVVEAGAGGTLTDVLRVDTRLAAAAAVRAAREVVSLVGEGSGATVYRAEHPFQRLQRDVETLKGHVIFDWDRATELAGRVHLGQPLGPTDMA